MDKQKGGFRMLDFMMDRNVLLYVLAAACAVGVVSQLILRQIYSRLIRDTKNTGEAAGRFQMQLRQRFQYCEHLNDKVGDVQALIRKSLMEYRFWGLNLHQWKKAGLICLAVSLLCAFAGTMAMWRDGSALIQGNTYFWMGAAAMALIGAAYGISDIAYNREVLEVGLTDYLQNSGAARDYREEASEERYTPEEVPAPIVSVAEGRRAKRRARAEAAAAQESRAQREKRELKENLSRMKTGMQETAAERDRERDGRAEVLRQMDPKDQERILKEVLKEFLNS